MIKDEIQCHITQVWIEEFKKALDAVSVDEPNNLHPLLRKARREALESQVEEMEKEVRDYQKRMSSGRVRIFFAWYDLWIGAYYNREMRTLYICPLPTIVIQIRM